MGDGASKFAKGQPFRERISGLPRYNDNAYLNALFALSDQETIWDSRIFPPGCPILVEDYPDLLPLPNFNCPELVVLEETLPSEDNDIAMELDGKQGECEEKGENVGEVEQDEPQASNQGQARVYIKPQTVMKRKRVDASGTVMSDIQMLERAEAEEENARKEKKRAEEEREEKKRRVNEEREEKKRRAVEEKEQKKKERERERAEVKRKSDNEKRVQRQQKQKEERSRDKETERVRHNEVQQEEKSRVVAAQEASDDEIPVATVVMADAVHPSLIQVAVPIPQQQQLLLPPVARPAVNLFSIPFLPAPAISRPVEQPFQRL
jgi:hypothetical protein